ncbi:hypothetical protein HBH56_055960 [Parastagonospora nodorum]|uniref:Uncharacterized protein n=1 Tax=Phaeosphaeria nodorum (strain SN15 / ATCC MYA-4574 / FGSC 10173) TaxID=321614 RepID=A0A7U2I743_PHANO|nr:hypothetical protein HBH56_055960 [Parastagonospora nodorum]QRD02437.1 hypothetical protein JI435_417980 [Parastagonospora nodorum SN15]KAH3935880.1 hypothetical protein HBH54_041770 [Parastagonospora nodorum]KAH4139932.1 hypothetical protein HBH45_081340 [Parastagonospora nodorum]KAH4155553.1 hypothetical protein HBH44_135260 [Parastagonospora nodorum]
MESRVCAGSFLSCIGPGRVGQDWNWLLVCIRKINYIYILCNVGLYTSAFTRFLCFVDFVGTALIRGMRSESDSR